MAKNVEYLDTDFLGNKINIGDTVIFESVRHRKFVIGKVITKAPKSCEIEYIVNWNYLQGYKDVVRQGYEQIIKYPAVHEKHGKWMKITGMSPPEYHGKHVCSECGDKALCKNHREELSIYCPNCGAKMDEE